MENRLYTTNEVEKIRADAYLKGIDDGRKALIEEAINDYIKKEAQNAERSTI